MLKKSFMISSMVIAVLTITVSLGTMTQAKITAGDITGGKMSPHVNIAAFHKLHGQESFAFPQHIQGDAILSALAGKAQFIFMNHTSGLENGDVIMVTNDVLRDNAGGFEDFGVGCQLSVQIKESQDVQLAGMCEFLMVDQNHRQIDHKGVIKPTMLGSNKDWVLIYNNEEDGIALYADEEIGLE